MRITGDADRPHAAAAKYPTVDRVDGAAKGSVSVLIAGDGKDALDARLAVQARQKVIQRARSLEIADSNVRNRLEAGGAQPHCCVGYFFGGSPRYRADIDTSTARHSMKRGDIGVSRARSLDGKTLQQRGNSLHRGGRLFRQHRCEDCHREA